MSDNEESTSSEDFWSYDTSNNGLMITNPLTDSQIEMVLTLANPFGHEPSDRTDIVITKEGRVIFY